MFVDLVLLLGGVQLGREVLDVAGEAIAVGVTTEEIDRLVHEVTAPFRTAPLAQSGSLNNNPTLSLRRKSLKYVHFIFVIR